MDRCEQRRDNDKRLCFILLRGAGLKAGWKAGCRVGVGSGLTIGSGAAITSGSVGLFYLSNTNCFSNNCYSFWHLSDKAGHWIIESTFINHLKRQYLVVFNQ